MNNKYVIIVAGGTGSRMKTDVPKQFLVLDDKPILMHTIEKFAQLSDITIVVVLPTNQIEYWVNLCNKYNFNIYHSIIEGGKTRFHSVQNGLNAISETKGVVAIHDGVRPFISMELIEKLFLMAEQKGNAIPFTLPKESIREVKNDTNKAVDRANYRLIQTPQCFNLFLLKNAYQVEFNDSFTDDASVFENSNHTIFLVEGEYSNIKITTKEDLPF